MLSISILFQNWAYIYFFFTLVQNQTYGFFFNPLGLYSTLNNKFLYIIKLTNLTANFFALFITSFQSLCPPTFFLSNLLRCFLTYILIHFDLLLTILQMLSIQVFFLYEFLRYSIVTNIWCFSSFHLMFYPFIFPCPLTFSLLTFHFHFHFHFFTFISSISAIFIFISIFSFPHPIFYHHFKLFSFTFCFSFKLSLSFPIFHIIRF